MSLLAFYLLSLPATLVSAAAGTEALAHGSFRGSPLGTPVVPVRAPLPEEHRLRLCNGVASHQSIEMRRMQEPQLVEYPLPFKACHDYTLPLHRGDELLFRSSDKDVGTFIVQSLPSVGSLLVLVPHQNEADSELSFASHVFDEISLAQVALIDVSSGAANHEGTSHSLILAETKQQEGVWMSGNRSEELKFDSVVSLTSGLYRLDLGRFNTFGKQSDGLQTQMSSPESSQHYLIASSAALPQGHYPMSLGSDSTYVALRVGGSAGFPEELVVFPHISLAQLDAAAQSKASSYMLGSVTLLAIIVAAFFQ